MSHTAHLAVIARIERRIGELNGLPRDERLRALMRIAHDFGEGGVSMSVVSDLDKYEGADLRRRVREAQYLVAEFLNPYLVDAQRLTPQELIGTVSTGRVESLSEPFCACGRVVGECDRSRAGCTTGAR